MRTSLAAIALLLLLALPAEAGIVVLRNGKVFLGTIGAGDVDAATVTVHQPRLYPGAPAARGSQVFQRATLRWFDAEAFDLTDAYCELFPEEPLDLRWRPRVDDWIRRRDELAKGGGLPGGWVPRPEWSPPSLSPIAIPLAGQLTLRKPNGWEPRFENEILELVGEARGGGFAPRIHAFSVESVPLAPSELCDRILAELREHAAPGAFEVVEGVGRAPRLAPGGFDAEWITRTDRPGGAVQALRVVRFRERRAYFATAYASARDFERLLPLFRECLGTLEPLEPSAGEGERAPAPDASAVSPGQRWTFVTATGSLRREVLAREPRSVRCRTVATLADGTIRTSEETLPLELVDPVARLGNPERKGRETLAVPGRTFECEVYEAPRAEGTRRVWLSSRFPFLVKETLDGRVVSELTSVEGPGLR